MTVQELINNLQTLITQNPKVADLNIVIANDEDTNDLTGIAGVVNTHTKEKFIMFSPPKLYKAKESQNPYYSSYWHKTKSLFGNVEKQMEYNK